MQRESWSNRLSYILTVAGATIGFGSTWRFPYLVGENGGGAFLLLFVIILISLGVPLLISESIIGRRLKKNSIDAFATKKSSFPWKITGYLGILGAFGILSYYMVIGGWVVNYIVSFLTGGFKLGHDIISPSYTSTFFSNMTSNAPAVITCTLLFVLANYFILIKGIVDGIEKAVKALMPLLFIILIIIVIRSITLNGAMEGIKFYLTPDFSKINGGTVLDALGQVFFALSIGFGVIITLSSYLSKDENIVFISLVTGFINTAIAFLAGFMIFPAIFAFGLSPASGPRLVFEVLPIVFSSMHGGIIFAILFFSLLLIAALTTSVTIYEVIITALIEKTNIKRKKAVFLVLSSIFILGNIPSILAYGVWSNIIIFGKNIFDLFDFTSGNILFVITAFLSSIFVGHILKEEAIDEMTNGGTLNSWRFNLGFWFLQYCIPIIIAVIFISSFL